MAALRFGVLGPLQVRRGSQPVAIAGTRRRQVLVTLVLHAGHEVLADTIIDAVWGDAPPANPRATLQTSVSRLRSTLGPDVIETTPTGYVLDVEPTNVDAGEFEALVAEARQHGPTRASDLLNHALGLWRGSAYSDLADSTDAATENSRLELLRLEATERHADAALESGNAVEAIALLDALLDEHPFREHAVALVMRALYHLGRQTEALARYQHYRQRLVEDTRLDPSPTLRNLEADILGQRVQPLPTARSDLPSWMDTSTPFIGRDRQLDDLIDAVTDSRVVTVTGSGGVGKSRLVAEATAGFHEHLGLPIVVVELARVSTGGALPAIADAIGLRRSSGPLDAALVEYLSAVPLALILDNCEHLVDELAQIVTAVSRHCRGVSVVSTSRHRLGMANERVLPLAPLPVPPSSAASGIRENPAVRLFVGAVRRVRPSYAATDEDITAVADVCRRLDGLPLALELAASRAAPLGFAALHAFSDELYRTDDRLGLRTSVEWSYQLLNTEQQRCFAIASVFAGTFTADALAAVVERVEVDWRPEVVVDAITELVESHLVEPRLGPEGNVGHRMLATVHSYARERLEESGRMDAAHRAHAEWVAGVVHSASHDWKTATATAAAVPDTFARVDDDVAAALTWATNASRPDLVSDIAMPIARCHGWIPGTRIIEAMTVAAEMCADSASPEGTGGAAAGATTAAVSGDFEHGRQLAESVLAIDDRPVGYDLAWLALGTVEFHADASEERTKWWRSLAADPNLDIDLRVVAQVTLALDECYSGHLDAARERVSAALAVSASAGASAAHAYGTYAAGEIAVTSDPDRGAQLFREAARTASRVGAHRVRLYARTALLAVEVRHGPVDAAIRSAPDVLEDLRRFGMWPQIWSALRIVAEALAERGRPGEAQVILVAASVAPAAPLVIGDDADRHGAIAEQLEREQGRLAAAQIGALATALPRAQVVERTLRVLEDLARTGDPSASAS